MSLSGSELDKDLIAYRDTLQTCASRKHIRRFNAFMRRADIHLGPKILNTDAHQIFSRGSFTLGGRYYSQYQNIPKTLRRAELTINREATDGIGLQRAPPDNALP